MRVLGVNIRSMRHTLAAALLSALTMNFASAALTTTGGTFFAQFVDGAGWKSRIVLQNQATRAAAFRLEFRDAAGQRLDVTLSPGNARSWMYEGSIPARGTVFLDSPGTSPTLSAGYVRLSDPACPTTDTGAVCNPGIAMVNGTLVFQQTAPGRPTFESSVPLDTSGISLAMPVDNSSGYTTAFAILNPSTTAIRLRATFLDEAGRAVTTRELPLAGRERATYILRDLIAETAGRRGTLHVLALSGQAVGLALLFRDDGPFSTLLVTDYFNPPQ